MSKRQTLPKATGSINRGNVSVLDKEGKKLNLYSFLDDSESFGKDEWDIDFDDYSN